MLSLYSLSFFRALVSSYGDTLRSLLSLVGFIPRSSRDWLFLFLFLFCFLCLCLRFLFFVFFCFDPLFGIWHLAFGIFGGTRALFCIREENLLFTSTIVYRKSLLSGKQRLIATAFKRECKERERERKSESESESESERARELSV